MQTELELTTKSKLLNAGISVFGDHGYAGGSIRQIAELADVNLAAVTYLYGAKKELWKAVFTHMHFITMLASNSVSLLAPHIKSTCGIDVFEEEQVEKFADAIISLFLRGPGEEIRIHDPATPGLTGLLHERSKENAL